MSDLKDNASAVVVRQDREAKAVSRVGVGAKPLQQRKPGGAMTEGRVHAFEAPEPSWAATTQYAQALLQMRRRRKRRFLTWFSLIVVLPTLATAGYFLFVATPRYTSEFELTYQTYRGPTTLAGGLVQSVTGTSQQNTIDLGTIMYEYVRSPALAEKLSASLDLRKHFSQDRIDWLSRISPTASRERFLDYFRQRVRVSQGLGGYLDISVEAFDPVFAQTLAKAVVDACDLMIDDLTSRARNNEVQFAESELGRQEDRVRKARLAMTQFQNLHGDQDPTRAAAQLGTIVGSLETDLANTRTQLANTQATLSPDSPIITQIKLKIASLEQQLKDQQTRLATDKTGAKTPYSEVLEQYSALQLEQEFAKNAYMAAQQGLVVARADAAAKQNYIIDFAPPNLPERMSYLVPIEASVTVLLVGLLLFGFGGLVLGAARDQVAG